MELIADILLIAGAFGSGLYCYVLGLRLKQFTTLETGMGGAIAVLSAQVDDMTRALEAARTSASGSVTSLDALAVRAEVAARRLELLLASLHDLPVPVAKEAETGAAGQQGLDPAEPLDEPQETDPDRKLRFVRRRPSREYSEAAE
jgi:hypothetical protein